MCCACKSCHRYMGLAKVKTRKRDFITRFCGWTHNFVVPSSQNNFFSKLVHSKKKRKKEMTKLLQQIMCYVAKRYVYCIVGCGMTVWNVYLIVFTLYVSTWNWYPILWVYPIFLISRFSNVSHFNILFTLFNI